MCSRSRIRATQSQQPNNNTFTFYSANLSPWRIDIWTSSDLRRSIDKHKHKSTTSITVVVRHHYVSRIKHVRLQRCRYTDCFVVCCVLTAAAVAAALDCTALRNNPSCPPWSDATQTQRIRRQPYDAMAEREESRYYDNYARGTFCDLGQWKSCVMDQHERCVTYAIVLYYYYTYPASSGAQNYFLFPLLRYAHNRVLRWNLT